jgi:hypothetical protein
MDKYLETIIKFSGVTLNPVPELSIQLLGTRG